MIESRNRVFTVQLNSAMDQWESKDKRVEPKHFLFNQNFGNKLCVDLALKKC